MHDTPFYTRRRVAVVKLRVAERVKRCLRSMLSCMHAHAAASASAAAMVPPWFLLRHIFLYCLSVRAGDERASH